MRAAVQRADSLDRVRVITAGDHVLEGRLRAAGETVRIHESGSPDTAVVAMSDIRMISAPRARGREAWRIGSFLGGLAGTLLGHAVADVNAFYTGIGGTVIGGVSALALERKTRAWAPVYPEPADDERFLRRGWFTSTRPAWASVVSVDPGASAGDWVVGSASTLGWIAAPRLGIGLEVSEWIEIDLDDWLNPFNAFGTMGLAAYWSPSPGMLFGATAGAAVGEHSGDSETVEVTDWGWSAGASAAWGFRIGRSTFIGPALAVDHLHFDGDFFGDITLLSVGIRMLVY